MDASVVEVDEISLDLELFSEVLLKLLVKVGDHGTGGVLLVDLVPKASSAHHCQPQINITFLQVCQVEE